MGPNSDVLENSAFFSKPVGPISHVFVGPNSYKSGGTRHVPPFVYFSIFKGGGWVHSVSFSADGNKLAWVGHDSSISVADATKENAVFNLKTKFLPFLSCIWIAPNTILAAGHGCAPLIFHQGYRDWVVSYFILK